MSKYPSNRVPPWTEIQGPLLHLYGYHTVLIFSSTAVWVFDEYYMGYCDIGMRRRRRLKSQV